MDRERRRAERRLGIQYAATAVLAESPRLDDAVPGILQALCDGLGWPLGAMWWVNPQADVLRCGDAWHSPTSRGGRIRGPEPTNHVRPGRRPAGPRLGERPAGLDPGCRPDTNFPRGPGRGPRRAARRARRSRLRSAATSWASWRSSAARSSSPTRTCSEMLAAIGSQIGQFMKRKQAEEAVLQERHLLTTLMDTSRTRSTSRMSRAASSAVNRGHGQPVRPGRPGRGGGQDGFRLLHRGARERGRGRRAGGHRVRAARGRQGGEGDLGQWPGLLGLDDQDAVPRP